MPNIFGDDLITDQPLATRLLTAAWQRQRLLPAYLLTGRGLPAKWQVAKQLAAHLNCSGPAGQPARSCLAALKSDQANWCLNCRWIDKNEHPQALKVLSGEGTKSGKIAVEKARELCEELSKASRYYRVNVVEEASYEIFHRPAANALLKTIEEPRPGILLLFFALAQQEVLPTVVSRCQTLEMISSSLMEQGLWSVYQNADRLAEPKEGKFDEIAQLLEEVRSLSRKKSLLKSIALVEKLQELLDDEEMDFDEVIDKVMALELKGLGKEISQSPQLTRYACRLLNICELAKIHNRQFVARKPVLEALAFSMNKLQLDLRC